LGGVERNFNATVHSIFSQVGSDSFKCIVACNEIPKLEKAYDDRLEFISLNIPTPTTWVEMARDKFWKLTIIAIRIREILDEQQNPENGIYVMPVDADDLLNCNLAKWCEDHPNEHGAVSADGYVWNGKNKFMLIYPEMHTFCGSCNIIKMYPDDLPVSLPADPSKCHDKEVAGELNARYPIRFDHNTVVLRYAAQGRAFATLPFRSTVYLRETGDNISAIYSKEQTANKTIHSRKFHLRAFLLKLLCCQYRPVTRKLKREFSIE
jgi:hypothetical protein